VIRAIDIEMPPPPCQRSGLPLIVSHQEIRFSRWPTRKRGTTFVPQAEILTKNPWEAIESAINRKLDRRSKELGVCLSFLYQALDFYRAYEAARVSSRPLLLYYALMNLAKTFIVYRTPSIDLGNAGHGLSENRGGFTQANITAYTDRGRSTQVFDLFAQALGNPAMSNDVHYRLLRDLLPQIVIGHRLWADAANKKERFMRAEKIEFLHAPSDKAIWTIIDLKGTDLPTLRINASKFLRYSGLTAFRVVTPIENRREETSYIQKVVRLEQTVPERYVGDPIEVLHRLP